MRASIRQRVACPSRPNDSIVVGTVAERSARINCGTPVQRLPSSTVVIG
jgi:hypothetical protein